MKKSNNNIILMLTVIGMIIFGIIFCILLSVTKTKKSLETDEIMTPMPTEKQTSISTKEPKKSINTPKPTNPQKEKKKKLSKKQKIKKIITDRIFEEFDNTTIDNISINDNYGTKKENDYIALVYLNWNQKNSASMTKEVLSMYSEDLSAYIWEECKNVQELAIFWTIPYWDDMTAKFSYERKKDGMYVTDIVF